MTDPTVPLEPEADRSLIDQAHAGERDAYDQIFSRSADRVKLFIRARLGRKLRSQVDSLDVLQDTYLNAHRDFSGFQGDERALVSWLCRIAERCIFNLADYHGAKKRGGDADRLAITAVLDRARTSGTGPHTAVARLEARARLSRALDRLDDDLRAVLLLRFFGDMPIDEIAELLGKSNSATRRAIGRATLELGKVLVDGDLGDDAAENLNESRDDA